MSDSDATRSPDSDETIPPDSPIYNRARLSPDLFGDSSNEATMTTKIPDMKHDSKRMSNVHDMSGSDSENESTSPRQQPKDVHQLDEKRKFINNFLNMSSSDSEDDASMLSSKQRKNSSPSTSIMSSKKETVSMEVKEYAKNKPYKQNHSRPFLSSVSDHRQGDVQKSKHGSNNSVDKKRTTPGKSSMNESSKSSDVRKSISPSLKKASYSSSHKVKDQLNRSENRKDAGDAKTHTQKSLNFKKKVDVHPESDECNKKPGTEVPSELRRSVAKVPNELRKAVTEILGQNNSAKRKKKTPCQYGAKCYRKNPSHFEEYSHNSGSDDEEPSGSNISHKKAKIATSPGSNISNKKAKITSSPQPSSSKPCTPQKSSSKERSKTAQRSRSPLRTPKTVIEKLTQAQPYSFFLTHVMGIKDQHNSSYVLDIKELLSAEMGSLVASCQLNFMFDIGWLIRQYPSQFRSKPLLIVHGEKGASMTNLQAQAMSHSNIRFCQSRLDIPYGTHHTKMMLLLYDTGMRVVIHTANLIENDWHKKTQGIWVSPLFPCLPTAGADKGDSPSHFKHDLIEYLTAYRAYQLKEWIEHVSKHDMSAAKVVIVGSVPGRHLGQKVMSSWGHCKLKSSLHKHGPSLSLVKTWPVIGQFSSIGSLGPGKDTWLCSEWLQSLSGTKTGAGPQTNARLQLIFPSKDNVRLSLEGFPAGGSIPYSHNTAKKQTYVHDFFHAWKSEGRGRSRAMPHIKTYMRPVQDGSKAAWFCCTSANLSKAAWGAFEKKGTQLMIRSYEIGVLFLPTFFQPGEESFPVSSDPAEAWSNNALLLPYDLPPRIYEKKDRPWMWDIPYVDLPDTNGNIWCPFSK